MMRSSVSVITPTIHRDIATVERCVASVRSQLYQEWEHIVCSDGENEQEVSALCHGIREGRLLYYWSPEPQGHYGAGIRQRMHRYAKGDYLMYLDDDNIIFPDYMTKMVKALDDNPNAGFAVCHIVHMGPLPSSMGDPPKIVTGSPPRLQNIDTLQVMVRAEVAKKHGWILDGYMSDGYTYEMWASHAEWVEVPEVLAIHF
jgi:glycosyltransferase involved in cell wall biosynthesis